LNPAALVIGLISGTVGGLVGLGGGIILVPLLTGWMHLPQHQAHGTSLTAVVTTALIGSAVYASAGRVDWWTALVLAIGSVVAARLAAHHAGRVSARTLRLCFSAFLIAMALLLPLKERLPSLPPLYGLPSILALLGLGLLIGTLSGLLGVGGGALLVPMLVLVLGLPQHLAQGTSLAAIVPGGFTGAWVYHRSGRVSRSTLPLLLLGVVVGSTLGGRAALALPAHTLRLVFAVVLFVIGLRYLQSSRRMPAAEPGT
jgi:uncharacterized protein